MANTLLIVADFINEIVDPKGAFGAHNAARIIEDKTMDKANELIAWARNKDVPIVHVKVGFNKDFYHECPKNSPMFGKAQEYGVLKLDTWSTEFHKDMDVQPQDIIVTKHRVSALYGTNLEVILRAKQITHVIICGVSTTYVVEATARELHDRDYAVTIISDACNAATKASHDASLSALSRIAQISTVSELMSTDI